MDDVVTRYLEELWREKEQEANAANNKKGDDITPADVARELVKDSNIDQLKLILDYRGFQEKVNQGELSPQDEAYKNLFNQAADIVYAKLKQLDKYPELKSDMDIWVVEVAKSLTHEYGDKIKDLLENPPDPKLWTS